MSKKFRLLHVYHENRTRHLGHSVSDFLCNHKGIVWELRGDFYVRNISWNHFVHHKVTGKAKVLISDGNSEIGAHVIRSNLCYLICLRHF